MSKNEIAIPVALFIKSITPSIVPSTGKIAKIIPVHKESDISILNNYRPIVMSVSKKSKNILLPQNCLKT